MKQNTSKTRRRRKEARPAEIVSAAMATFIEEGFGGATIEQIARRAGVAKGTIYLYFKSKEELFAAAVRENISPALSQPEDLLNSFSGSTSDLMTQVIQHMYAELIDKRELRAIMRILIGEGARFPHLASFYHEEVILRAQRMLTRILQRGVQTGEFRQSAVQKTPQLIMGPAIMAAVWKIVFEESSPLDLEQFAAAHVELALNGLRTRN